LISNPDSPALAAIATSSSTAQPSTVGADHHDPREHDGGADAVADDDRPERRLSAPVNNGRFFAG
jgi:hypothetical protein